MPATIEAEGTTEKKVHIRHIQCWLSSNPLSPVQVDCVTSLMLKILDGKCKMDRIEKDLIQILYRQLHVFDPSLQQTKEPQEGIHFTQDIHLFIKEAQEDLSDSMRMQIYERRVLAETMISRPIMKQFKAHLRTSGFFPDVH